MSFRNSPPPSSPALSEPRLASPNPPPPGQNGAAIETATPIWFIRQPNRQTDQGRDENRAKRMTRLVENPGERLGEQDLGREDAETRGERNDENPRAGDPEVARSS